MYRILIADDEAYVRDLVAKSINLSTLDVEVVGCAEDGTQAIDMVEQLKPDILITDICMPKLSGLELIKAIKNTGVNIKTVIISGYDDFAYAKTAMELGITNYLLKPFLPDELFEVIGKLIEEIENNASLLRNMTELQTQFDDNLSYIQERFLKDILMNKSDKKNLLEEARAIKLDMKAHYYCCGILKLQTDAVDIKWSFSNQNLIEDFLRIVKDEYFDSETKTYAVSFHDKQLVFIYCSNHTDVFEFYTGLRTSLEKMNLSFQKYYNIRLVCALGKIYPRLELVSASYEEALLVTKTILPDQGCVMNYEEAKQILANRSLEPLRNRPQELEEKLILNIRLARKDKALAILNEIIQYYESFYVTSIEYVSMSIFGLVFALDNALMESGSSFRIWQDEKMKQYFKDQLLCGSLYDTKVMLESYISRRCDEFSLIISNQSDKLVYDIKTLIEHNLSNEDFNLESASSQLFFSANYVRQVFKQKTGEGFTEYLIQKRMELAGELLQNPTNKIQDVAQSTGYSSQRYFSSCFKKYYGCTPTEYREKRMIDK
ncbi:MAG: two component transcriptional regulator, AraC family [Herbinix sp.]|jgi:two-component system response regulator YesN|nr:two component transcriptional regulator, AraC family [Herbinix sp.]